METGTLKPGLREPLMLTAVLLAYSNGLALWAMRRGESPDRFFHRFNRPVVGAMLAYAALRSGGLASVGLRRRGLRKSLLFGAGMGAALSIPPLFFFYRPILLDTPLEYGPISRLTRRELVNDLLVDMPISIALLEELAFRGLLYSALRRSLSARASIIYSSLGFAGWHFAVTATSAAESNLSTAAKLPRALRPYVQPLAVAGGMLTTGVAGLLFGTLRERTGNLAGSILAHWIVDGAMIAALWLRRPKG
jgi:membrane protease YdiL (CAAX protease family)